MSRLTPEEINNIRNSIDLVDVVSEYIPLSKKGKNFFGVCPFHDDSNPSLSVSKEKQIYTCFSCGATGNVINFMMDYEQISFVETMKKLADKAGISVDLDTTNYNQDVKHKELFEIYEVADKFYTNNIKTEYGVKAINYLKNRKLNDEIIAEFGIGLALKNKDMLSNLLISKKFEVNDILKSGLANEGDQLYDVFYNRIMFPLHNPNGKVVGYSGRIYDDSDTAKYVNTKETEIFKKGEMLYNYKRAKDFSRVNKQVIIVEGFMDVIRLYSVGIKNVVAVMGTAFTKNQANLIKKMAKEVVLCFDGDAAGRKATMACGDELIKAGITPKVVRLPDESDPDEFILNKGGELFNDYINNAISIMDFKIDYCKNGLNLKNSSDLATYINKIIDELNKIDDDVLREVTIHKVSEETKIDSSFLKEKLNNSESNNKVVMTHFEKSDKYQLAEKYLLHYMLKSNDVVKMYRRKVSFMPTYECRLLAIEISEFYEKHKTFNIADLYTILNENPKLTKLLGEVDSLSLKEDFTTEDIEDYIRVISDYNKNQKRKLLQEKMRDATSTKEKLEIAEKIRKLKVEE